MRSIPARLAFLRHAASVRPEPGSNSPYNIFKPEGPLTVLSLLCFCWIKNPGCRIFIPHLSSFILQISPDPKVTQALYPQSKLIGESNVGVQRFRLHPSSFILPTFSARFSKIRPGAPNAHQRPD